MTDYDTAGAARESAVAAAVGALRRGDLVVLPTDTVYGLAADAFTPQAVARLLQAKGRGRDMPVPVLVGAARTLDGLVDVLPESARLLAEAFWPGALTIVVRHARSLAWDLGEARGTVAVRMPLHPVAVAVLTETGPLAVSSANRSGSPPATTAAEARAQLGDSVAVYLHGDQCQSTTPSTIVDVTGEFPRVLRVGALPVADLRTVLPGLAEPAGASPVAREVER